MFFSKKAVSYPFLLRVVTPIINLFSKSVGRDMVRKYSLTLLIAFVDNNNTVINFYSVVLSQSVIVPSKYSLLFSLFI